MFCFSYHGLLSAPTITGLGRVSIKSEGLAQGRVVPDGRLSFTRPGPFFDVRGGGVVCGTLGSTTMGHTNARESHRSDTLVRRHW